jgi:hypothetical protein
MVKQKKTTKGTEADSLWKQGAKPIKLRDYSKSTADTEKLLIFSETGAGKTTFYLDIIRYLKKKGLEPEKFKMMICYPDRPSGISRLFPSVPSEYKDGLDIFPVSNYEETIRATATIVEEMDKHFKETGVHGWGVFELMENYWTFSQDYYCRKAYGETMADYFTEMQSLIGKGKAEKKTAYEAFAGPFGGPWPAIKFHHNFNWIDKLKRMPFNIVFTSEIKEEDNKDSIFSSLGYRPAGEKHNQHKMDTILYLGHKKVGSNYRFTMKPFKLTGYRAFYPKIDITDKIGYEEHKKACKKLEEKGYKVTKMNDLEEQAEITPPKRKKKKPEPKPKETSKQKPKQGKKKEPKKEKSEDDMWSI